jgi:dGTPase
MYEGREKEMLAPYAQLSSESLGRSHPEEECVFRTCFYRDLGRIVHSMAFRLLEYKTQVFVSYEGDYYRTRLTHSLEVGQISKGLARILKLNEDLAYTIALAHDLGHPPFGHPGEEVLDALMKDEGGFEHNLQGYRVVTELEERYPDFRGLNLSYEVLEGILKHTTDFDIPKDALNFRDAGFPTLEAQVVNFADEIAFMNHDLDDGLHWGMLTKRSLGSVELWNGALQKVEASMPDATDRIKLHRAISFIINDLITDLQNETVMRINAHGIRTLRDVRERGSGIVAFSGEMTVKTREVKGFLLKNMYHYPQVVETRDKTEKIIRELFGAYLREPNRMPPKFAGRFKSDGSKRHICDYIAGMTDRFAIQEHERVTA